MKKYEQPESKVVSLSWHSVVAASSEPAVTKPIVLPDVPF